MNDVFRSKWFWIVAPILALFVLGGLVTFAQNAGATPVSSCGGYQYCIQSEQAAVLNVIAAGNIQQYVTYQDVAHVGDTGSLSIHLTTPGISGTPSMTYSTTNLVGCVLGTSVTQNSMATTTYKTFTLYAPLTLTDTTCTGSIRTLLMGGLVSTELWDQEISFTIRAANDMENFNKECEVSSFWDSVCSNTDFYNLIGSNVFEFLALIIIFIMAIVIWNRSNDYGIRYAMVGLALIPGLMWLNLYLVNHFQILLTASLLTFIIAGYMGIRAGMDLFDENRENKNGNP